MSDKLFLAWNCPECVRVKSHISKMMFEDDFVGKNGQTLTVIHTFSNDGTRDILDIFGMEDVFTPALLTNDSAVISGTEDIISYLKDNNLTDN